MEWLWSWSGRCVGYREGVDLWISTGGHIGRFVEDVIYAPDGRYLGELATGRLIQKAARSMSRRTSFAPKPMRAPLTRPADYAAHPIPDDYEDFPMVER